MSTQSQIQVAHAPSHNHEHYNDSPSDSFIFPLICIGLCCGYALTLWKKSKARDYPELFLIALCALPTVTASYVWHIYTRPVGADPFLLILIGMGVFIAGRRQALIGASLPALPMTQAWAIVSLLTAIPSVGSFAFFLLGLRYQLKIRDYLIPYFTMSGIIWLSSGALGQLWLEAHDILHSPVLALFSFGASLLTPRLVWFLFERFEWRLIQLIGLSQSLLVLLTFFYG